MGNGSTAARRIGNALDAPAEDDGSGKSRALFGMTGAERVPPVPA